MKAAVAFLSNLSSFQLFKVDQQQLKKLVMRLVFACQSVVFFKKYKGYMHIRPGAYNPTVITYVVAYCSECILPHPLLHQLLESQFLNHKLNLFLVCSSLNFPFRLSCTCSKHGLATKSRMAQKMGRGRIQNCKLCVEGRCGGKN